MERRERETHKAVSFGSAGVLISNDDGFKDITKLLEMATKGFTLSLPSEATDEYLSESRISERRVQVVKPRTRNRLIRHETEKNKNGNFK